MPKVPLKLSKSEKAEVRDLNLEAWEHELSTALMDIHERFGEWAENSMSAFDLCDELHEFQTGIARDLFKMYAGAEAETSLCRAIASGFIDEDSLSESLQEKLSSHIEQFRRILSK